MANQTILAVGPVPQPSVEALLQDIGPDLTVIRIDAATLAGIENHDAVTADTPVNEANLDPTSTEAQAQWDASVDQWVRSNIGADRQGVVAAIFTPATFDQLSDPTGFNRGAPAGSRFNDYFPEAVRWISVTDDAYEI